MVDLKTASTSRVDAPHQPKLQTPRVAPPDQAASTEVLITEQEVLFGTAAALPARRESITRRFFASLKRIFSVSADAPRPARRNYPRRYEFLERSLMAREMERL